MSRACCVELASLGSTWEAAGAGSAFGVTPSISLRPSGQTMWRSNIILTPNPPSDSDAASVVGSPGVVSATGFALGSTADRSLGQRGYEASSAHLPSAQATRAQPESRTACGADRTTYTRSVPATASRRVDSALSRRAVYPTPCARPGGRTG
jgi:hypothetical protein